MYGDLLGYHGLYRSMNKHRPIFEYSSKRLRRARSLYFNQISNKIPKGEKGIHCVNAIAKKLQERGIYAQATSTKDIAFRCYRHMYKRNGNGMGWFEWIAYQGYGRFPWRRHAA